MHVVVAAERGRQPHGCGVGVCHIVVHFSDFDVAQRRRRDPFLRYVRADSGLAIPSFLRPGKTVAIVQGPV